MIGGVHMLPFLPSATEIASPRGFEGSLVGGLPGALAPLA
jgi:hypothetical protein